MYYKDNILMCEEVSLKSITDIYKTPFYVYSKKSIIDNIRTIKDVFLPIDKVFLAYALKAENNISILKLMVENGIGADVVSMGEINKYLKAGGSPDNIVFSGVSKSCDDIKKSIELDIKQFNIESIPEALRINDLAKSIGKKVKCAIRVNPNIDALTHYKITTGSEGDKFGISVRSIEDNIKLLKSLDYIEIDSLAIHIGSQMLDPMPFYNAITVVKKLCEEVINMGFNINTLDIGGGFGVRYDKSKSGFDFSKFKDATVELLKNINLNIIVEPGRFFVAEAGALIMKVEYVKREWGKNYVIVNAGMNDYIRVAMYDAYNEIVPLENRGGSIRADFVGPVCESSDIFAYDRQTSDIIEGDYIALLDSGAYGASMSSNYNMKPLIAQILVDGDNYAVIRKEQTFEHMIENEIII